MFHFVLALLVSPPLVSAVFFHEHSAIELKGHDNSAFGFSLGYQKGSDAKLVIGAPRYSHEDHNGRVSQCSIRDIDTRKTCNNIPIKFEPLIKVNRTLNPDQYFYLGASIAATEKGFVTCAPLRTTNAVINREPKYDAFGVCFTYDDATKAAKPWNLHSDFSDNLLEGGGGWSTLVDEKRDRIIISQFMTSMNTVYGDISKSESYTRLLNGGYRNHTNVINKMTIYGQAMTFGNYFDENKTNTYYAFSMKTLSNIGAIDFFSCNNFELESRLEDGAVGSMFGAALASGDVTGDGRDELFVGAPAQVDDASACDRGAVHVYTHTVNSYNKDMGLKLTIWGMENGGRFGTTMATNDVDGDSYPEIIISAPFEKAGGALYIICGYELHKLISSRSESYERSSILVWDLARMQRIQGLHSFGLSLQPIADFNDNGSDELAVGSPTKSTVTLYRGVRAIAVHITSQFKDDATASKTEFVFFSCVTVEVPPKPNLKKITSKLLVRNILTGENASFKAGENATYELNFETENGNHVDDHLVKYCRKFHIDSPLSCKVNTVVSLMENIQEEKGFKKTWVTLSPQSNLNKTSYPTCKCDGTCTPDYTLEVQWAGLNESNKYVVGSSDQEMVKIVVHNHGTMGCNSCAAVHLSGTIAHTLPCHEDKRRRYKCELPTPFRAGTNKTFDIRLLTNTLSNQETNLTINVAVRKNCNESEAVNSSLTINYDFRKVLEKVTIDGSAINRTMTDTEMGYETEETFSVKQTFTILNNQSFKWSNVSAKIDTKNLPYIQDFKVWMKQSMKYCAKSQDRSYHHWLCLINLAQNSMTEITITTTIIKKELAYFLQGNNITIMVSTLKLELFQDEIKNKMLTSIMTYERVLAGENKTHITIIIAFVVALAVLLLIVLILYKLNFFKRKNKEELEELKREMHNRSMRSVTSKSSGAQPAAGPAPERDCDTLDLIVDETPFDDSLSPAQLNCLAANPDLTPQAVLTPMPDPAPKTEKVLAEIAPNSELAPNTEMTPKSELANPEHSPKSALEGSDRKESHQHSD